RLTRPSTRTSCTRSSQSRSATSEERGAPRVAVPWIEIEQRSTWCGGSAASVVVAAQRRGLASLPPGRLGVGEARRPAIVVRAQYGATSAIGVDLEDSAGAILDDVQ